MRVAVDDPGHNIFICGIDDARVRSGLEVFPNGCDFPIAYEYIGILQGAASDRQNSGVLESGFPTERCHSERALPEGKYLKPIQRRRS
jgi:hypothetical protein